MTDDLRCIHAHTPSQLPLQGLVPYVNLSRFGDGSFVLTVRTEGDGAQGSIKLTSERARKLALDILAELETAP